MIDVESVPVAEGAVPSEQTEDGTQQPGEEISGEAIPSGDVPSESVPDSTMPSESVPPETTPVESVPDSTVPSESVPESASAETNPPITDPITPEATPSEASLDFDIEAELDKREMRSKKFGTAFDRELCRQQLLREHSGGTAVQFTVDRTADSDVCIVEE